jgi:hypothetical protein
VLLSRARITMLVLLAAMLMGSLMTASAAAETAGPFWRHREAGSKGEGEKIESKSPESLSGPGSAQTFTATIGGIPVEVRAASSTVKGSIFNNALRGQGTFEIIYNQPTLVKPEVKGCNVTVGSANIVTIKTFLAWKWNGTKEQLEEKPQTHQTWDLVAAPTEPSIQKPEPEILKLDEASSGGFTTVTFSGSGCGAIAGTFTADGSVLILPEKLTLGEFNKTLNLRTIAQEKESFKQHIWNGERYLGILVGLHFASEPANIVGQYGLTPKQEITVAE